MIRSAASRSAAPSGGRLPRVPGSPRPWGAAKLPGVERAWGANDVPDHVGHGHTLWGACHDGADLRYAVADALGISPRDVVLP